MLLKGARIALNSSQAVHSDLWIRNGAVSFSPVPIDRTLTLCLDEFMIVPGLINAHDHLELNLFPRLGHGPYANASAWAQDIHRPRESPVKEHLSVPKGLRLTWGAIKNLLSGVTTVAHHNPFHSIFLEPDFPVRVVRRYGWAHSIHFSPDWHTRLERTPVDCPFLIHAAEGTDEAARSEISTLGNAGALRQSTILVHGVGVNASGLARIQRAGAGVVWCPTSNHFTLGRSLQPAVFDAGISVALGNDSAMTAQGDLLDELRFAHQTVSAERLYAMVTSEPARMLKLPAGFGRISPNGPADLLVMKDTGLSPAMTLLETHPQLVILNGQIQLISSDLASALPTNLLRSFQQVEIEGRGTYLFAAPVATMLKQTTENLRQSPRLAGKAMAA